MEDDKEFESGYAATEAAPAIATPDTKSDLKPAPEAAAPVADAPKVDPLQELRDIVEKQNVRLRNTEGHIGGLNSTLKQMSEALAAAKAAAQDAPTVANREAVKAAEEKLAEWDAVREDFPELTKGTEQYVQAQVAKIKGGVSPDQLLEIEAKVKDATSSLRKEVVDTTLNGVLDNWVAEINTPDFTQWMDTQPADIKALVYSDKIADAARMLRMFGAHKTARVKVAPTNIAARQKRIEAAVTPKGTGGYTPSKTDLDEFEAGYSGR